MRYPAPGTVAMIQGSPSRLRSPETVMRTALVNADPFTNAVRITVSGLRKRLGEPWIIATVSGVGYRIDTGADDG